VRALAPLLLAALPLPAGAQDHIEAPGRLSDEDFYRAVACAAPPGGDCGKPFVRWDASRPVRVALRQIDDAFLGRPKLRAGAALDRALQALNDAEAGFRLARVEGDAPAEIEIFFLDIARGQPIAGTGIEGVDGARLGGASTRVLFNPDTGFITRAAVVFSTTLETRAYESVMLEELTQAMGLMTDIKGPAYRGVSVLDQDTNTATELAPQDIMALRRHYARN
jgi:hypothetical protein